MLRFGLVLVVVAGSAGRAHAQCDPYSEETEVAIPKQLQLASTCGNGRIDPYAVRCTLYHSGGCGLQDRSSTVCPKTSERCDGRSLGGNTCQTLGYIGGKLRCAASCTDYVVDGCTLCPAGPGCRERRVVAGDFADLVVVAQGETVRALWSDQKELHVADIATTGELVHAKVIAPNEYGRPVAIQVGSSAMQLVGKQDKPELAIVKANGDVARLPLAGAQGTQMFMPILSGQDLGVIVLGDLFQAPRVIFVDDKGAEQPPPAKLYASNSRRAVVIEALAPGTHHAKWATFEDDFVTERGDMLFLMWDAPHVTLAVIHRGVATWPFKGSPKPVAGTTPGYDAPDVAVDGALVATFNYAEHVAFGVHHSIVPVKPAQVFGAYAYNWHVGVARTSSVEVQVARVPPGIDLTKIDYDHPPDDTLLVSVRKL